MREIISYRRSKLSRQATTEDDIARQMELKKQMDNMLEEKEMEENEMIRNIV